MSKQLEAPVALLNLPENTWGKIMRPETIGELSQRVRSPSMMGELERTTDLERILAAAGETEILVTGWGSTPLNKEELKQFKRLKLILHTAGTMQALFPGLEIPESVAVTNAAHINARPVAEYSLGLILASARGAFQWRERLRQEGMHRWWDLHHSEAAGYPGRTIAIVGFGSIAKHVIRLLSPFEFRLLVVSPYVTPEDEATMGIKQASIEQAAEECAVMSLHEADLPPYRNMINADVLRRLKDCTVLINTARGNLIDEDALLETLRTRPITALLDVLKNENVEEPEHPLLELPNCYLTPHIAGSVASEIPRLGDYLVREVSNYVEGRPLENQIPHSMLKFRA